VVSDPPTSAASAGPSACASPSSIAPVTSAAPSAILSAAASVPTQRTSPAPSEGDDEEFQDCRELPSSGHLATKPPLDVEGPASARCAPSSEVKSSCSVTGRSQTAHFTSMWEEAVYAVCLRGKAGRATATNLISALERDSRMKRGGSPSSPTCGDRITRRLFAFSLWDAIRTLSRSVSTAYRACHFACPRCAGPRSGHRRTTSRNAATTVRCCCCHHHHRGRPPIFRGGTALGARRGCAGATVHAAARPQRLLDSRHARAPRRRGLGEVGDGDGDPSRTAVLSPSLAGHDGLPLPVSPRPSPACYQASQRMERAMADQRRAQQVIHGVFTLFLPQPATRCQLEVHSPAS